MINNFEKVGKLIEEKFTYNIKNKKSWNKGERYADIIENIIPKEIENILNNNEYKVKGRVGTGNYSDVPWIAIFNTNITEKTHFGYYIAYLFHPEGTGVYLSLNQGWTEIKNKSKNEAEAKQKALSLSKFIESYLDVHNFNKGKFSYSKEGTSKYDKSGLPMGYAYGSIIYKYYDFTKTKHHISHEMKNDLIDMQQLLDKLVNKISKKEYANFLTTINDIDALIESQELNNKYEEFTGLNLTEIPQPNLSTRKKKKSTTTKRTSDSDIDKANKENKLTGVVGEKLAYEYFIKILDLNNITGNKKEEFVNMLDLSKSREHGHGYDMVGFDPYNLKEPVEKLIEIKTTTSKKEDEPFYLSLNELYAILENPKKYLIFRIIDINSDNPKFYIIDPYEKYEKFENIEDLLEKVFNFECLQFKIFNAK